MLKFHSTCFLLHLWITPNICAITWKNVIVMNVHILPGTPFYTWKTTKEVGCGVSTQNLWVKCLNTSEWIMAGQVPMQTNIWFLHHLDGFVTNVFHVVAHVRSCLSTIPEQKSDISHFVKWKNGRRCVLDVTVVRKITTFVIMEQWTIFNCP